MNLRIMTHGILIAGSALLYAGVASATDPIRIGHIGGYSGPCGPYSTGNLNAMRIAVDEINAAGGVLGRKIELLPRNSLTKPDEAAKQAREAFVADKVDLLTGPCTSSELLSVSAVAKEHKKLLWTSQSNTHRATIDFGHPYIFQSRANTLMESRAVAEFIATQKNWKRIVTIGSDFEWPHVVVEQVTNRLKELRPDITIVRSLWPKLGESNFSSHIAAGLNDRPDVILLPMFGGSVVSFVKQAKAYGLFEQTKLITMLTTDVLISMGADMPEGVYGFTPAPFYAMSSPRLNEFVAKYKASNKQWPDDWAVLGYDSMLQIADAIRRANSLEPSAILDALAANEYESLRGPVRVRKLDGNSNAPTFLGATRKVPGFDFPVLTNVVRVDGNTVMPSEAEVRSMRSAAKK